MTNQRRAVLDAVIGLSCHPTAEDVYDAVRQSHPGISLSTVYRNLGVLVEQGEISAVRGPCNELHYDHMVHDHCHLQCSVCGDMHDIELATNDLKAMLPGVASGFSIENVYIVFTGVCPSCASGNKGEDGKT
jgi:Fe2+ or Zn2+ uptake regulation protein